MSPAAMPAFDLYRQQVEAMVQDDGELAGVESVLDRAELDTDARAALWLLAWSLSGRRRGAVGRAEPRRERRRLTAVRDSRGA